MVGSNGSLETYEESIRSAIGAIHPIGSFQSTKHATDFILERTRGKLAATLAATLAHPIVIDYLSRYPQEDAASFDPNAPSPFAAVLLPLINGPHMGRNLRFYPQSEVEPLAYARAVTIANSLKAARSREDSGEDAAHYGALEWISSCARQPESLDHFIVYLHDRQVHGAPDRGHNSLSRILSERDRTDERSKSLYAHLAARSVLPRSEPRVRSSEAPRYAHQ